MKRYLLFTYIQHDEKGGWNDFTGDTDDINELQGMLDKAVRDDHWIDGFHVVDTSKGKIVVAKYWHAKSYPGIEIKS